MAGNLRHIELWKNLEEKAREATKTRQMAEETLAFAEKLIDEARKNDANVVEAEKIFAEASGFLAAKDYKVALEKAGECKEKITRLYRERIQTIIDSNRFLVDMVKSVGGDVTSEENGLRIAEEALLRDEFAKANDLAKESWKKAEKSLHESISRTFSSAQALILTAKGSGKDVKKAEELLARARHAVDSNDYEMAINSTKECIELLGSSLKEEVFTYVDEAKTMMELAKEIGFDTRKLDSSLQKINSEMDAFSYESAMHYSKQFRADAEKMLQKAISDKLDSFIVKIKNAEKIEADVSDVRETISEARGASKEGKFQLAIALIKEAEESTEDAQFEVVLDVISSARPKFVIATNIGADITKSMDLMNKAREALKNERFEEALLFARKMEGEISQFFTVYEDVQTKIRAMENSYEFAELLGLDTKLTKEMLARAKSTAKQKDFKGFVSLVNEAHKGAMTEFEGRIREHINKSKIYIEVGEELGANVSELKDLLKTSSGFLDVGDFRKAVETTNVIKEKGGNLLKNYITKSMAELKLTIQTYVRNAEDAKIFDELLLNAQDSLNSGEYEKAYSFVKKGMTDLNDKLFGELKVMLDDAESSIAISEKFGYGPGNFDAKLADGRKALESRNFRRVIDVNLEISRAIKGGIDRVFIEVKSKMMELKNMGLEIGPFMLMLRDAAIHSRDGDVFKTYLKLNECYNGILESFEMRKRAYDTIAACAVMIAEAKKNNIDIASVLDKLKTAKSNYEAKEYRNSLRLAEEVKSEVKGLIDLFVASQKIIGIKSKLTLAKDMNIQIVDVAANLMKATDALKNRKFEDALRQATEADTEITLALTGELSSSINATQTLISEAKDVGLNVKLAEDLISKARVNLAERRLRECVDFTLHAKEEVKRLRELSKRAAATIKKAQDAFNEVEGMGVPIGKQKDMLKDALRKLEKNDYETALNMATRALTEIEAERDNLITKTIANFQDSIRRARNDGINTAVAEKIVEKATLAFNEKKYREALELAMQSEGEIERVSLQQDMALKALNTAKRKIESFQFPTPKAELILNEGQDAFKKGDYAKALELAIQSGDEFYKVVEIHDEAMDRLQKATKFINTSYKVGAKALKAEEWLKKANSVLATGNFELARQLAEKSIEESKSNAMNSLNARITRFEKALRFADGQGLDVKNHALRISEVRALISEEDYDAAGKILQSAYESVDSQISEHLRQNLKKVEDMIFHAKKLGADTSESESLLIQALSAMEKKDFDKVIEFRSECERHVEPSKVMDKRFIEVTYQAESMIGTSKKFGMDVKEAEAKLQEAMSLKDEDMEKAIATAERSLALARKAVEEFAPEVETSVDLKKAKPGEWTDGELTLTNKGKTVGKDITVSILGDVEIAEIRTIPNLKAGGTVKVPVKIRFPTAGNIPLAVKTTAHRLFDERLFRSEKIEYVEVMDEKTRAQTLREGAQKIMVEEEIKCDQCMGRLKLGTTAIKCTCDKVYHEQCAARADHCPSCGADLNPKQPQVVKRKKLAF